jgi:hypothetical protein
LRGLIEREMGLIDSVSKRRRMIGSGQKKRGGRMKERELGRVSILKKGHNLYPPLDSQITESRRGDEE